MTTTARSKVHFWPKRRNTSESTNRSLLFGNTLIYNSKGFTLKAGTQGDFYFNKSTSQSNFLGSYSFSSLANYAPASGPLEQRAVGYDAAEGTYIATTPIISATNYGGKGAGVFISANGTTNGIAWLLNGSGIEAYDTTNI